MTRVFLFPGQGSQEIGMGADLFRTDRGFEELVRKVSGWVGVDLQRICLRGPERELRRTEYLQPLLVAVSLGYHRKLLDCGIEPQVVLGHSLGEISALAAAGVISCEEAIRVAAERGRLMGIAAAQTRGGMLAVLSPQREQVLGALAPLLQSRQVFLANDNAPNQLILSGTEDGLAVASNVVAQGRLGVAKRLAVAGPWHSPLMFEARKELARWLDAIRFEVPKIPLLMNVSATYETDPERIRSLIACNLTEPVQWRTSLERLAIAAPLACFEVGPGRILSGLMRANGFGQDVQVLNVNNDRGLTQATLWRTSGKSVSEGRSGSNSKQRRCPTIEPGPRESQ